jgi:glycerophosphoryl diester phosphodiesterase
MKINWRKKALHAAGAAAGAAAGCYAVRTLLAEPRPRHPFLEREDLLVMAHRGGGGLWPQNTMYAFERAAALGVDVLELDIHATRDGELVVIHDPVLDVTTDGTGWIRDLSLAEIKKVDAGSRWTADGGETFPFRGKGIKVPTLIEVLEAFPEMRLNIDIKPTNPAVIEPFSELLGRYHKPRQVMVGSFHDSQVRLFRAICPEAATAAGVWETRLFYALSRLGAAPLYRPEVDAFQVPEYAGEIHLVDRKFVAAAHAQKIDVHAWTVDEISDMQRLIDIGVDGLISDFPNRLVGLVGR